MATGNDSTRERELADRAIGYGLVLLRHLGEAQALYRIESETDLTLEQAEQFVDMIAARKS